MLAELPIQPLAQFFATLLNIPSGSNCFIYIIILIKGCVEHSHSRITDKLIKGSVMGEDTLGRKRQIFIQYRYDLFRLHALRQRRKPSDIHEKHRNISLLAAQNKLEISALGKLSYNLRSYVFAEYLQGLPAPQVLKHIPLNYEEADRHHDKQ